jgi:peroxisomal 2,4-dienoyl-CoA reductase
MTEGTPSPFRLDLLKGHVALITGGGSGIGFGIAQILGRHGAKLAIMGRRESVLQTAVESLAKENIPALALVGDVRDMKSCELAVSKVVAQYGGFDILINCAAGNFLCKANDLSANAFKTVIEIDLIGTFNMSKASFSTLCESSKKLSQSSNIINISATLHYGATFYQAHASAAKAGVDSLTRSLAREWGEHNIRVNGIAPGPIADTEGMKRLGGADLGTHSQKEFETRIPLSRAGTSHEIGFATLFLASNLTASYITGDTLVVDGGSWLVKPSVITPEIYEMIRSKRAKL